MKTLNRTRSLIGSLAVIGGSLLAYPGGARAAAPEDEGAQAFARALLSPPVRSVATAPGSGARAGERVPAPDAQQLAQRILSGAPDVPADRRVTSAVQESAAGRLRLAERRHDADVHQLIRRMILGQGV